jgi:hypothetical protein
MISFDFLIKNIYFLIKLVQKYYLQLIIIVYNIFKKDMRVLSFKF